MQLFLPDQMIVPELETNWARVVETQMLAKNVATGLTGYNICVQNAEGHSL